MKIEFDHVAILVKDLKLAVENYKKILGVLDSKNSLEIVWDKGVEGGYEYEVATFVNKGDGPVFQLLSSKNPKDIENLERRGEHVHHIEFCTKDVNFVHEELKSSKIPLLFDTPRKSESMPWQNSTVLSPKITHGVLIKVATSYDVKDSAWVPRESDNGKNSD